jgi:hypothetical protein
MIHHLRLQELLERQLSLVRQGRVDAALELFDETQTCVQRIAGETASPQAREQRQHMEQLYRELSLALTAQRAETAAALNAIHQGKRLLDAYSRTGPFRR